MEQINDRVEYKETVQWTVLTKKLAGGLAFNLE